VQPRREIASTALFEGEREIQIRHADKTYTLRQTSKGKLILTK
jgi:hemin uptake protein HemP